MTHRSRASWIGGSGRPKASCTIRAACSSRPAAARASAAATRRGKASGSVRQWDEAGRYGVWGGLLEAERAAVRAQWLAGVNVVQLLAGGHETGRPPG